MNIIIKRNEVGFSVFHVWKSHASRSVILVECKHFLEVIHWEESVGDRHALQEHS